MAKYCPNCGRSAPSDALSCPYCGKPIPSHVPDVKTAGSKKKDDKSLIVLIIAIIVIVAIVVTIAIAATVYVYVSGMIGEPTDSSTPNISFVRDDFEDTLTVASTDEGYSWIDITLNGIGTLPTGTIDQGDTITGCQGSISIIWEPTNTMLGMFEFTE